MTYVGLYFAIGLLFAGWIAFANRKVLSSRPPVDLGWATFSAIALWPAVLVIMFLNGFSEDE